MRRPRCMAKSPKLKISGRCIEKSISISALHTPSPFSDDSRAQTSSSDIS